MRTPSKFGLIFGFTGLIVALSSLIIISSSLTSKRVLSKHARMIMENIASYTIDKAENHLAPARNAAQLTRGLSKSNIVKSNPSNSMVAYFYEQLFLYPQFSGIYFGAVNGEFIMATRYGQIENCAYLTKIISKTDGQRTVEKIFTDKDGLIIKKEFDLLDRYDPRKRPWFKKAIIENQLIWTDPYIFFTSQKPGITTAEPVYSTEGQLRGVIGVDIGIHDLSTFINKLKVGKNGRAFILSQKGDLIAYPDMDKIRQNDKTDTARLTKIIELDDPVTKEAFLSLGLPHDKLYLDKPIFTSFKVNGEKYNAMFTPFNDAQWPWVIGIYMPENDYLGPIKTNRSINIAIATVTVIIALLLGLAVARKLNRARESAESATRAKSQFLTRMSHEIRTPMNAILGAGEMLSETNLNGDQRRYVSIYRSAGEHLRDLISAVLDLSKIETGKYKLESTPFSLHQMISSTCEVFFLEARDKGLQLSCNIATGTPEHVEGDPTAIRQILVNLIGNAIKFTPSGSVSLSVDAVGYSEQDVKANWVTVEFSVTDTGIGIPEDKQKIIFDRFTQADGSTTRKYGGTGLGLAISRDLTALMGGEMTLESRSGAGSTFTFTTPLKIDPYFGAAVGFEQDLLVEDDERNRLLFTLFLKDIPHTLETAESGEEALNKHFAQPYDLILMDIEMPGMDGHEATRRIRSRENENNMPPTPIIAVTAHAIKEEQSKSMNAGCTDYLPKPTTKARLRKTVEKHLGVSIDPANASK